MLNSQIDLLQNRIINIDHLFQKPRQKRSLLPFLGSFLSTLTGTATQDDIAMLNNRLESLAQKNQDLTHVMADSLTIVNATQIRLGTVSKTVDQLIASVRFTYDTMINVTSLQFQHLVDTDHFISVWGQVEAQIGVLEHGVTVLTNELDHFELRTSDVLFNRVTTHVISPTDLKQLLKEVSSQIGHGVALPWNTHHELVKYYEHLLCETFPTNKGIGIVLSIPLVSANTLLDLFKIVSFPVPFNHGSLQLNYDIDSHYIGLTPDKTEIVHLSEIEYLQCTKHGVTFCHLTSPFRFVSKINASCATTLVTAGSIKHCSTIVKPNDAVFPQIRLLTNGKWVIISEEPLHFTVLCKNHRLLKTFDTTTPLDLISIPLGCRAKSTALEIPPTYYQASHIRIQHIEEFHQRNISILTFLPDPIRHATLNTPHELNDIVDSPISLQSLKTELLLMHSAKLPKYRLHSDPWIIAVIVFIVLITLTLIALLVRYYCSKNYCRPHTDLCSSNKTTSTDNLPLQPSTSSDPVRDSLFPSLAVGAQLLQSPNTELPQEY
jgi:hypothetical protein